MFCLTVKASCKDDELLPLPLECEFGKVENIISGLIDFPKGAAMFLDDEVFNQWLSTL